MEYDTLLRQAEQALMELDAESIVALYSPDFIFEDIASGERITNKPVLRAYFDRLFALPDVSFTEVTFFSMGNRAAGRWTWSGSSLQSGDKYAIRGASLFKVGEGGIEEEMVYYDPRSFSA